MKDAAMEQVILQGCEETEIDLFQAVKVVVKRKKTFIGVFLLVFGVGFWYFLFFPEIYRISVPLYVSSVNEMFTDNNDKFAKDLKGSIISNAFNAALRKKLNLDPGKNNLGFNVTILDKSNILEVSMDLESRKKEFGVVILQNLAELIFESYAQPIEIKQTNIVRLLEPKERAKKKAMSLQVQIREITVKEDNLIQNEGSISINTAKISDKRKKLIKTSVNKGNFGFLFSRNQIKENYSIQANWVNKQFNELSLRKKQLDRELEDINSQISNFQMQIDKLNISKDFMPSLKIISLPKVSPVPVNSKKIKTLGFFITIGLLSGVLAVLLQESWASKLKKT